MAWSERNIETLKSMWAAGATASEIAEHIGGGLSRNSVIGKAHRLGLGARGNPADFVAVFERVVDRIVDAPIGAFTSILQAAQAEGLNPTVAYRMWDERIVATHGGDPQ